MKKIAKILVPVDFSDTALKAYRFAQRIAAGTAAELHLLHVTYPQMENIDHPLEPSGSATDARTALLEERMAQFVADAEWKGERTLKISTLIEVGAIIPVIRKKARDYDLIVMGTRGEHALIESLLGTVASDVVIHATCPVVVVPQYTDKNEMTSIAYAVDLKWVNEKRLLEWSDLLNVPQRVIHLVFFGDANDPKVPVHLQKLKKSLAAHLPDSTIYTHKLRKHELVEDLSQFSEQNEIDLLIMYRGRNSWKRKLFHRSLTRQMAGKTKIPLLVV
ncbi:MAG: universal stress protein [Lewinella sp.]|nr:universal stress protein [Lewinella sp.]